MTRRWRSLGLLLSAALVAHVLMLAGHHHDPGQHASAADVVAHGLGSSPTTADRYPPDPGEEGAGATAVGAACLVALAGAGLSFLLQLRLRTGPRAKVRRRSVAPTVSPPVILLLRPPQTPVAERVVLLR
jgi:hypothetical protein